MSAYPLPAGGDGAGDGFPGPLLRLPMPIRVADSDAAPSLFALARARAHDPAIFDEHPPVFFSAVASNSNLDTYFTRMAASSLKNYAEDAAAGVPLLDSHRHDSVVRTLGHSLTGRYTAGRGDKPARTTIDFYTLTGLDPAIDGFVGRLRAGLARDVSIGFRGGRYVCSLCGGEMFDWHADRETRCPHIPGFRYPVVGKDGKPTGAQQVAEAGVEDAHLAEVSTVFDGATPDAAFTGMKARALFALGDLSARDRDAVARRYPFAPPDATPATVAATAPPAVPLAGDGAGAGAGGDGDRDSDSDSGPDGMGDGTDTQEVRAMAEQEGTYTRAQLDAGVADAQRALRDDFGATVGALLRAAGAVPGEGEDTVAALRALCADTPRLRQLADDGATYRADLIEQVATEGVRAFGNDYEAEQERAELAGLPLAGIKRRLTLYRQAADQALPAGRATEDGPTVLPTGRTKRGAIPNRAYSS